MNENGKCRYDKLGILHRIVVKDILAIAGDPSDPIKLHCIGHENLTLQIMLVHCTVHHLALCAAS